MGLDMYFFQVPKGKGPDTKDKVELKYFRKHSDLHGWLEDEWRAQNSENENAEWNGFNCVYMEITPPILMRLKDYLTLPEKKHYQGFFWGATDDEQWKETRELVARMEEIINSGDKVYYYSWW